MKRPRADAESRRAIARIVRKIRRLPDVELAAFQMVIERCHQTLVVEGRGVAEIPAEEVEREYHACLALIKSIDDPSDDR